MERLGGLDPADPRGLFGVHTFLNTATMIARDYESDPR